MDCKNIKQFIPEYISGELEKDKNDLVKEHILSCSECFVELEKERNILDSLSQDNYFILSDLNNEVIKNLPKDKKLQFLRNIKYYSVAASILILIIISVLFTKYQQGKYPVLITEINTEIVSDNEYGLVDDDLDDLIAAGPDIDNNLEWGSDDQDIFESESEIVNDLVTLEEVESYDSYLTSL